MRSLRRQFPSPRWAFLMEQRLEAERSEMELRLKADIKRAREMVVSDLGDRISTLEGNVNSVGAAIQTEIQQFRDAIASGSVSEADLGRLDALSAQLTGNLADLNADDAPPAGPPAA